MGIPLPSTAEEVRVVPWFGHQGSLYHCKSAIQALLKTQKAQILTETEVLGKSLCIGRHRDIMLRGHVHDSSQCQRLKCHSTSSANPPSNPAAAWGRREEHHFAGLPLACYGDRYFLSCHLPYVLYSLLLANTAAFPSPEMLPLALSIGVSGFVPDPQPPPPGCCAGKAQGNVTVGVQFQPVLQQVLSRRNHN